MRSGCAAARRDVSIVGTTRLGCKLRLRLAFQNDVHLPRYISTAGTVYIYPCTARLLCLLLFFHVSFFLGEEKVSLPSPQGHASINPKEVVDVVLTGVQWLL